MFREFVDLSEDKISHCNSEETFQEGLRQYGPKTLLMMQLNVSIDLAHIDT